MSGDMGEIWGAPSPWLSLFTSASASASASGLRPFQPPPHPTPTPNPTPTPTPPASPLGAWSRSCGPPEQVRRGPRCCVSCGAACACSPCSPRPISRPGQTQGALARGRSHLLVAVVVKLPCSTGQQKDAATLASVRHIPAPTRADCPPAPCTSHLPRAHGCTAACRWPLHAAPHAVPGATDELAHGRHAAHCRGRAGRTTLTLTLPSPSPNPDPNPNPNLNPNQAATPDGADRWDARATTPDGVPRLPRRGPASSAG